MVEIRIDTNKDSPDQLRKVIAFLQGLVGEAGTDQSATPQEESTPSSELFSIFDTPQKDEPPKEDAVIEIVEY